MIADQSFGIIPLKFEHNQWLVLIIKHRCGHWSFPKGHPEAFETPQEAASRELKEECGLNVIEFWSTPPLTEKYTFYSQHTKIEKTVTYYIAEVAGTIVLQLEEVSAFRWVPLDAAVKLVTFREAKLICEQVVCVVKKHSFYTKK